MAAFYYGLIFGGRKCLHATPQKRALPHAILLAVNYRLFSHGDVSYRFNDKNDNVVLEWPMKRLRCLATSRINKRHDWSTDFKNVRLMIRHGDG